MSTLTTQTKNFSDFGIKVESKAFIGKSIDIVDILDQEIIVHDFKIEPSLYPKKDNDQRLTLQIEFEGKKRVVFSGSIYLLQMIQKVPKPDGFPFTATIKKDKETKRLEFK